jgi:peptide/nickel transport system substrate-binding protein
MASVFKSRSRALGAVGGTAVLAIALAGCAGGGGGGGGTGGGGGDGDGAILVGTTDKVTTLDPAGSYDNGSLAVQIQVFPFLLNQPYGSPDVEPDIAESAEFTSPTEYTVVLKEGLTWANGNDLTASDVKFTFDRQLAIAADNGPSSLLYNLESTEVVDDTTVVFHLKSENDQVFPQILSSFPGAIVDEEVFSATEVTPDEDIVEANAVAGQYVITDYDFNSTVVFEANPDYQGLLGPAENEEVILSYYADSSNLKLDVQEGEIDVAHRSLSATDIEDLRGQDSVTVHDGPGGEIRYIVFNFATQPSGTETDEADEEKALAVRQAVAALVDRAEIAEQVYKGTYTPLYSFVPDGFTGATEVLKDLYGENGAPSVEQATQILEDAGVETPVALSLQYNPDHYGPSSGDEYALVQSQLNESGLFEVELQSTEWVQYSKDRVEDVYPAYQLGWFPDYSDADNYLTPFFLEENFLDNHFSDPEVQEMILQQAVTADPGERTALIEDIQARMGELLSTVPLLQGAQVAIAGTDVQGVTLDASFKFRFAPLTKG